MVTVIFAHPHLSRSRAAMQFYEAAGQAAGVRIRNIYDDYPDFDVDAQAERDDLAGARAIVFVMPVIWYSSPALLQQWIQAVFGWSPVGGSLLDLSGRRVLWTGILGADYDSTPSDQRGGLVDVLSAPMKLLVRGTGGRWEPPVAVFTDSADAIAEGLARFRSAPGALQEKETPDA